MGCEPVTLPDHVLKADFENVIVSTQALSLPSLPKSMIIIGGGIIGLELGSHFCRMGTKVTIVEFLDRLVAIFDSDVSKEIKEILTQQGLNILTSTKLVSGKVQEDKSVVCVIADANGENQREISAEKVLISVGRKPCTKGINLEQN